MITVGLFLFLTASAQGAPRLSLDERCSLVATILQAPAKREVSGGAHPRVLETPFLQVEPVQASAIRRGRAIVRPRWQVARKTTGMFAPGESCGHEAFVLEQAAPEEQQVRRDPRGNSDHVIVVTVKTSSVKQVSRFSFEETLGLSIHAHLPEGMERGGYAVPPTNYSGTVERAPDGKWQARVTKALFAW